MPWPPSSMRERTVASVGFLPLVIFSFLKRPFRPGPIFFSSESALWQTAHCSKTSLPLAASPLPAESTTFEAPAITTQIAITRNRYIVSISPYYEVPILQCPMRPTAEYASPFQAGTQEFALISLKEAVLLINCGRQERLTGSCFEQPQAD